MNQTIWKYPLEITDVQEIEMPSGAKVLHAGLDPEGQPCLWVLVMPDMKLTSVHVQIFGTGNPTWRPDGIKISHVGSFNQDRFVWHVFVSEKFCRNTSVYNFTPPYQY